MKNFKYVFLLILFPLFSFGQGELDSISGNDKVISVYVFSKSKITLNGERISIQKLDKHLKNNQITQAKIGTLKPTPIKTFSVFEKVVKLMEKHEIKAKWYSDPGFQKPFFDDEKKNK